MRKKYLRDFWEIKPGKRPPERLRYAWEDSFGFHKSKKYFSKWVLLKGASWCI
jgi:hypothetical protein